MQTKNGSPRKIARGNRSSVGSTLGRAVRWFDDWTVEAFNPVYPHNRRR
jgi:hypothetical protein